MNKYFLHHAIRTAAEQIQDAGFDASQMKESEVINIALKLAIIERFESIAENLEKLQKKLK